jgi:hypothetical protein
MPSFEREPEYKLDDLCVVASPKACTDNELQQHALIATEKMDIRYIETAVREWWDRLRQNDRYIEKAYREGYTRRDFAFELLAHIMAHLARDLRRSLLLAERVPARMSQIYERGDYRYTLHSVENHWRAEQDWHRWIINELELLGVIGSRSGSHIRTRAFFLDNYFFVREHELDSWVAAKLLFLHKDDED